MTTEHKPHREPDALASTKSGCSSDATDDPSVRAGADDGEGKSTVETQRSRAGNPPPASYQHSGLRLVPVSFAQANEFVAAWHRHNDPMPGAKFSVGVADGHGVLRGVAMVGRPVARHYDDGDTLEVCRVATDGTRNTGSMLYGACQRAAFALGYRRLITYTLASESGSSLRASGWSCVGQRPARKGWSAPSRPRDNTRYETVPRQLWEAVA